MTLGIISLFISCHFIHIYIPVSPHPTHPHLTLILRTKINTDTINTMSLILWIAKPLSLEDMTQMAPTIITHNLRAHHAETRV